MRSNRAIAWLLDWNKVTGLKHGRLRKELGKFPAHALTHHTIAG